MLLSYLSHLLPQAQSLLPAPSPPLTWPSQTASNWPLCLLVSTSSSKPPCAGLIFLEHNSCHYVCESCSTCYHMVTSHTTTHQVSHNTHQHGHIVYHPRPCVTQDTLHTVTVYIHCSHTACHTVHTIISHAIIYHTLHATHYHKSHSMLLYITPLYRVIRYDIIISHIKTVIPQQPPRHSLSSYIKFKFPTLEFQIN